MKSAKRDYVGSIIIGVVAAVLSFAVTENVKFNVSPYVIAAVLFILCPIGIFVARFFNEKFHFIYQLAKFSETGGLNTFLDLGVLNILIITTGITHGAYFSLFKGISFVIALINSYFWNKFWVFAEKKTEKATGSEFLKFLAVSLTGFLINVSVASLVVFLGKNTLGIDAKMLANLAAVSAVVVTLAFNFLGYKLFVFKR